MGVLTNVPREARGSQTQGTPGVEWGAQYLREPWPGGPSYGQQARWGAPMVLGGGEGGQESLETGGLRGPSSVGQDSMGAQGMAQWGSQGRGTGGKGQGRVRGRAAAGERRQQVSVGTQRHGHSLTDRCPSPGNPHLWPPCRKPCTPRAG